MWCEVSDTYFFFKTRAFFVEKPNNSDMSWRFLGNAELRINFPVAVRFDIERLNGYESSAIKIGGTYFGVYTTNDVVEILKISILPEGFEV
jgi:hypothetical protein